MDEKNQRMKRTEADSAQVLGQNSWAGDLDPGAIRACCGLEIKPYLAEMRDNSGSSFFVSVWQCPRCGRTTF